MSSIEDPWIIEDENEELVSENPETHRWWTKDEAQARVEAAHAHGVCMWAFPRTAIGLPI